MLDVFQAGNHDAPKCIGIETEKFILDASTMKALPVYGSRSIQSIMQKLHKTYDYEPLFNDDTIIALFKDGHQISLEPGGQIEFSASQSEDISELYSAEQNHLKELSELLNGEGLAISYLGCQPLSIFNDVPWVKKHRYKLMRQHFENRGDLAEWMMKMTSSTQISVDFDNEHEASKMCSLLAKAAPVLVAICASSPVISGNLTGYKSFRTQIWSRTDSERCGLPDCLFSDNNLFKSYAEYAADVPMFFSETDQGLKSAEGRTFREFCLKGKFSPEQIISAWRTHLTCLFPEIRLKHYLEIRCFDRMPGRYPYGIAALLKGLLYHPEILEKAAGRFRNFSPTEARMAYDAASRFGLQGFYGERQLSEWARELHDMAKEGLVRLNSEGKSNIEELEMLDLLNADIIISGKTIADRIIEDYQKSGDLIQCLRNPDYFVTI